MIRFHAVCETCKSDLFKEEDIAVVYRLTSDPDRLKTVQLDGRSPWSGVRCVCVRCCNFIKENSK